MNEINQAILQGIQALKQLSPSDLEAYGNLLLPVLGTGLSGLFMFMKKLFKVNRGAFMFFAVLVAGFVTGSLLYVNSVISGNPLVAGTIVSLFAYIAYHGLLRPIVKKYSPFIAQKIANAKTLKELRSAVTPVVPEEDIPGRITTSF